MRNQEVKRKKPLSIGDLQFIDSRLRQSRVHDDILFAALISTGFHGLLRLGELTFPDSPALHDWRKVTKRSTVTLRNQEFYLPTKQIGFSKATELLSGHLALFLSTLVLFSFVTCLLMIISFLLLLLYG